jgi:hypothetical protein
VYAVDINLLGKLTLTTQVKATTLKWSEVSYVDILVDKGAMFISVTLYCGHLIILWLFHFGISCTVFVLICTVVVLYCSVMCVCVCVCVCVYVWVL